MKHYYPAVFETAEEGGYTVTVPDIEGCFTEGRTLEQAMWMAQDAIGCMLEGVSERDYPPARNVNDIDTSAYTDCFVTLVEFDRQIYERRCRDIAIAREQLAALAQRWKQCLGWVCQTENQDEKEHLKRCSFYKPVVCHFLFLLSVMATKIP